MIAWMLFAALVAALAGLAGLAAERGLALFRLPTRGAWAASIATSLALPLLLPTRPAADDGAGGMMMEAASAAAPGTPLVGGNAVAGGTRGLDPVAPWAWLAASAAVAGVLAAAAWRLARRRRGWTAAVIYGEPVLLSGEVGPAVVGFVRPSIVIPRWTLDWPEPRLRMIVRHEREHVAAADPALLLAALCAAVLVPWSPALWWQLRRLRLAVEVDCDARTLRAGPDPAAYGRLLLEVGSRGRAGAVPLAAFSEPRSFLERRIRAMTLRTPRNRALRLASWTALAATAAVSAAALPAPPLPAPAPRLAAADTSMPTLLNAAAVRRELAAEYPPMLRAAGVTGTAVLRFRVDESGAATDAEVVSASHPAFAEAALRVLQHTRWTPARGGGARVTVPFAFQLSRGDAAVPPPATAPVAAASSAPDAAEVLQLSAVDQQPELVNREATWRLLEQGYPPLLRAAGVEGRVVVSMVVGADGLTRAPTVVTASHEAFEAPALAAAAQLRFRPARKGGRPVAVRISLPMVFQLSSSNAVSRRDRWNRQPRVAQARTRAAGELAAAAVRLTDGSSAGR